MDSIVDVGTGAGQLAEGDHQHTPSLSSRVSSDARVPAVQTVTLSGVTVPAGFSRVVLVGSGSGVRSTQLIQDSVSQGRIDVTMALRDSGGTTLESQTLSVPRMSDSTPVFSFVDDVITVDNPGQGTHSYSLALTYTTPRRPSRWTSDMIGVVRLSAYVLSFS